MARSLSDIGDAEWRTIELGRGGYTVTTTYDSLLTNQDGTFTESILDSALFGCERGNYLERCSRALNGQQPTYILLALGTNDVNYIPPWVLPNETTWKAKYLAIIDTLHDQFPESQIGITKPWKRQPGGDEALFDVMAGWIDEIVASRQAFTFVLDDERTWFGQNAATYSNDTPAGTFIHYNTGQGQAAGAAAKKTALGF